MNMKNQIIYIWKREQLRKDKEGKYLKQISLI